MTLGDVGSVSNDAAPTSSMTDRERWDAISRWNEGIREEFFSGQWAGRPVYIDLEDDVIERIARRAGTDAQDAEAALAELLRPTLHTAPRTPPLLSRHVSRTLSWRRQASQGTPPFLAILAFLSLVAEGMHSDGEFRASNYYGRFCQAIGLDPSDRTIKVKVQNGFVDGSQVLWGALNDWLDSHGGGLGLPTAYAFDSRTYVGPPLSQALVRDADRRLLPEMFAVYRLRPGQVVSRSDMARLLGDWAANSRLSSGLKRLLERGGEVAARVADVACVELQAWNGESDESAPGESGSEASLLLTAQLRTQPRRRLYLDVGMERLGLADGPFVLGDAASDHARAALASLGGAIAPLEADGHGWRGVAGSSEVSIGDLLLADVTLRGSSAVLHRPARRLVVLEHDEEVRRYIEVARIQLGASTLLLCHESLAGHLSAVLEEIARPGWRAEGTADLQGVPEGWVVFSPVEVLSISDTEDVDLMPLVPLSWTQISLGGGFPLPGRLTWLGEDPPEIRVSSAEGESLAVGINCERPLAAEAPEDRRLAILSGPGAVAMPPSVDGDFRVLLLDADRLRSAPLASTLLRLRSADTPRPVLGDDEPPLRHCPGEPLWALSASASSSMPEIDGALLRGFDPTPRSLASADVLPPPELFVTGADSAPEENDLATQQTDVRGGEVPSCLLGGGHHFVLPPNFGPEAVRGARIEGTCKLCGLEKDWPRRPGRKRRPGPAEDGKGPAAPTATRDLRPIVDEAPADWDRLMTALSYAQRGPWATLDAMASRVDDAPWFSLEAGRLLSSLGHLSIALQPRTLRPLRWSLAPTTIAVTSDEEAILCGYRSEALLALMADDAAILDGRLVVEPQPEGPAIVQLEGLDREGLSELVASSAEAFGRPLLLSDRPAMAIANQLPPLAALLTDLSLLERAPGRPVERFDFEGGSWVRVDEVEGAGAYRFVDRPLRYCVATDEGAALRLADNRMAKWLGAQQLGLSLLAYEEESNTLLCPLGCQLPGLYERAAVLASGRSPIRRRDGAVAYPGVPAELASELWSRLGPEGVTSQG